jgi:hypothetical protein
MLVTHNLNLDMSIVLAQLHKKDWRSHHLILNLQKLVGQGFFRVHLYRTEAYEGCILLVSFDM